MATIDPRLLEWATPRQREIAEAYNQHGSESRAAKALGVGKSCVNGALLALKKKAARMGYAPECDMTRTVPDGYVVKGVSTYYDKDGKPSAQWVKSAIDPERMAEIMREMVQSFIGSPDYRVETPFPHYNQIPDYCVERRGNAQHTCSSLGLARKA